jgi:FixJ family two-component response regulator
MAQLRKVVAVVDDDESMLRGLQRLLKASGFDTEGYSSAEAFLGGASTSKATCLVLDVHLSGISGIELRRRLSKSGSTLGIIFMTAVDDEVLHLEAIETGCVAFLRKPFPACELMDAVATATSHPTNDLNVG